MRDSKGRKSPVRIPIPRPGGPMKDKKKYNRKRLKEEADLEAEQG